MNIWDWFFGTPSPRRNPRRVRRNVDFRSEGGTVHPIRGSEGYDPAKAGEKAKAKPEPAPAPATPAPPATPTPRVVKWDMIGGPIDDQELRQSRSWYGGSSAKIYGVRLSDLKTPEDIRLLRDKAMEIGERDKRELEEARRFRPDYAPGPTRTEKGLEAVVADNRKLVRWLHAEANVLANRLKAR